MSAKRLGTHPDERGTGRILAALPVVCVATEGIAVERGGKWGGPRGLGVRDTAQLHCSGLQCTGRRLGLVRPSRWKKVTMASVQERSVESRNASRSLNDPAGFHRFVVAVSHIEKSPLGWLAELISPGPRNLCKSWRASPETETQIFHTREKKKKRRVPSTSTRVPLSDSPWHSPYRDPRGGFLQSLVLKLHWIAGERTNCRDGASVCLGVRHSNTSIALPMFPF